MTLRSRLLFDRYDTHPELEGERLISNLGPAALPLHYDIKR